MDAPQIIKITKSERQGKKMKATFNDGKIINFGSSTSQTYVEGATKSKRHNYLQRHLSNKTEKQLITNLKPSPALLSAELLWGKSTDLSKNIAALNKRFKSKF